MLQPRVGVRAVFAALIILSASLALAQNPGTITGAVRDPAGAPLPGATVTITSQETGQAVRVVHTSTNGAYEASGIAPGLYSVTADMPGFRRLTQRAQILGPGATLTVNFSLELRVSEEVKVTAMKREETVTSTPVSVTAPTEEVLRDRGAQDIEDVSANVPNFSVQNLGPGQTQVAIRGISSGQIVRDQPGVKEEVGSYLDESVISLSLFTPDLDLFDVSRVEVLRGPQGTLFGSGSVGGTVRYITNQPEIGSSAVFGEVGGDTIQTGGLGGDFKAGFNASLGSKAALRVAAYYNRLAGWMDAVQPNLTVKKDVNSGDKEGARIALELAPTEGLTITPRFVYQKLAMEGWNREDVFNILANPFTTTRPPVTLGDQRLFTQIDEPTTDKFQLGDLNIKYNFGPALLTSITTLTNRDILVTRDAGALTSSITGGSIGLPQKVYTLNSPLYDATRASGWTQELRLSSANPNDRFQWVGGGFYADLKRHYSQTLVVSAFEDLTGIPTASVYAPKDNLYWSDLHYKLTQYAIFGEGTFAVTDRFSATAGLRYYHFKEDKQQIFDGLFGEGDDGKPLIQPGSVDANGIAPRFIASYKVTDSTTINAQAARGFRLGGVNDPLLVNLCTPQDKITFSGRDIWKDETAWNYEIGSKSRILGGRGVFNASAFYDDVKDLQVTVTAGSCSSRLIFNVPKARAVGGEVEFGLAPTNSFDFSLSAGYTDSTVRTTLDSTPDVIQATGIRAGNRLPSVPKFQAAVSATYHQPITQGFNGYVTGTYQHTGSRYTQIADQEPGVGNFPNVIGTSLNLNTFGKNTIGGPLTQSTFTFNPLLPAYDLVNLRLGVRHDIWDVAFYVNNLTNEHALLALDRERGFRARVGFLTNQPRTFGVNTRVDF